MAAETLLAQIIHEAPSALLGKEKEWLLLPACSICGHIREDSGSALDHERWVTQRMYRKTHDVNPADYLLTRTYCPQCFTEIMEKRRAARVTETMRVV